MRMRAANLLRVSVNPKSCERVEEDKFNNSHFSRLSEFSFHPSSLLALLKHPLLEILTHLHFSERLHYQLKQAY